MATTPHEPNQRLKPAQAASRHRGIAINAQGVRKPIIRPSCLGEFEWPQVGEFEVAIRGKLHESLAHEIATRGDRRIPDATSMATEFIQQIDRDGRAVVEDRVAKPAIQLLINAGLDPDDIDPSATFGETMDLLTFQKRLRVVAEGLRMPWVELKRRVTRQQLPVMVIEESMRHHAQDQPERKGSELNDTHLLCLAPYADRTFVDKRTLENARRARNKSPMFDRLIVGVARARDCAELAAALTAQWTKPLAR